MQKVRSNAVDCDHTSGGRGGVQAQTKEVTEVGKKILILS